MDAHARNATRSEFTRGWQIQEQDLFFGDIGAENMALCCTHVFDTTRGQWSTLSDMPEVVGGRNRTCLKYVPA